MRITKKILLSKLETINSQLQTSEKDYNYALNWCYGGVKLVKLNEEHMYETDIHYTRLTNKELNSVMEAIININFHEGNTGY